MPPPFPINVIVWAAFRLKVKFTREMKVTFLLSAVFNLVTCNVGSALAMIGSQTRPNPGRFTAQIEAGRKAVTLTGFVDAIRRALQSNARRQELLRDQFERMKQQVQAYEK